MNRPYFIVTCLLLLGSICQAQTAAELYTKGAQLKKDKKAAEAIVIFKEVLRLEPNHKEALYDMGWCQNDVKDYMGAIVSLRKARNLWSANPQIYFELGWAFEKTDLTDSAVNSYKKCLELNANYSGAHRQLGYIAYQKSDYPTAIESFRKFEEVAKTPSTDYLYWYRKGFSYNATKNYTDAKTALNKSLEFKTDYINTWLELGFSSTKLKENDEAIRHFNKAMTIDAKSHIPYNGIAEVYRDNIKNMQEAMNWYGKTLAMNPNERKANFGMGYCLNSTGKFSEAINYLRKAIEAEPTYTAAYVELGYSYFKTGSHSSALDQFTKALSLNPANENARYYAGLVYISQGNRTQAQKMADELKSLNSKNASSLQEKVSKM